MHILEEAKESDLALNTESSTEPQSPKAERKVDIVDGMAELQSLNKPAWIKQCSDLATHFSARVLDKYSKSDEVRIIFDAMMYLSP